MYQVMIRDSQGTRAITTAPYYFQAEVEADLYRKYYDDRDDVVIAVTRMYHTLDSDAVIASRYTRWVCECGREFESSLEHDMHHVEMTKLHHERECY